MSKREDEHGNQPNPHSDWAKRRLDGLRRTGIDPDTLAAARAETRRRQDQQRKRDVIDVRAPAKADAPVPPTPEQAARADYVVAEVFDKDPLTGRMNLKGKAFQRRARFESIEGLTRDQLRALRFYRAEFDRSELSEIKCGLDIEGKGGGGSGAEAAIARTDAIVAARFLIRLIEAGIPAVQLPILRAVALDDQDFKTIAIATYGGRDVERIDTSRRKPTVTTSLEPRSGRHRENVRQEFLVAARNLVGAVVPYMSNERQPITDAARRRAEVEAETLTAALNDAGLPAVDPAFLDENGRMLPFDEIRTIILERFAAAPDDEACTGARESA